MNECFCGGRRCDAVSNECVWKSIECNAIYDIAVAQLRFSFHSYNGRFGLLSCAPGRWKNGPDVDNGDTFKSIGTFSIKIKHSPFALMTGLAVASHLSHFMNKNIFE